ncbi:MAG: hypothetical protein HFG80_06365 [Eubacterium sp.]|nr:hypothetical protein [Eubacterium sp.]
MAEEVKGTEQEEKEKKPDRKAAKKAAKAEKKARKDARKNGQEDVFDEEKGGSKIAVLFVTIIIIVVWLAILALIIKADVGGFGSTVLAPILKDVPYVNKILPDTGEPEGSYSTNEEEAGYNTLDEAVARIKELELQLQEAKNSSSEDDVKIEELEAQIARLSQFEAAASQLEEQKAKFDKEVVFSDQAPDINEYKTWYESIDPTNAELLYKEVIEQQEADAELEKYISMYSSMKPSEVAAIFDTMTDQLKLVAKILQNMEPDTSGAILGKMNTETAAKLTALMEP